MCANNIITQQKSIAVRTTGISTIGLPLAHRRSAALHELARQVAGRHGGALRVIDVTV